MFSSLFFLGFTCSISPMSGSAIKGIEPSRSNAAAQQKFAVTRELRTRANTYNYRVTTSKAAEMVSNGSVKVKPPKQRRHRLRGLEGVLRRFAKLPVPKNPSTSSRRVFIWVASSLMMS